MANSVFERGSAVRAGINWNFFVGASILVGGALLKFGAPLPAVLLGVGLIGFWNWYRSRSGTPPFGPR